MPVILNETKWNEESQHTIDASFVRMKNKTIIFDILLIDSKTNSLFTIDYLSLTSNVCHFYFV
ncbi:hypothetical protein SAMN05421856_105174 [Chryseobacterium taichungense]|uniref:Uncharacterized protein n=1 Tax=Chryseobacterium taichungense TaxID=295069 RepID=A0A1H8A8B2_9FLAO|nr:hypothetical protein [Chryseobacterium taichungense]SEM66706.1 hypothetical protein SAMN05421856_105174 [Chryseobacterium taichungense]